jgi:tetratricopeptide (TPR) repeat protein
MPEKTISEISAAWRELYEKGTVAYQRQNLDYAIDILTQILDKEPAFYDCREALRAAQFKKASGGTSFFKKAFGKATTTGPLLAKAQQFLWRSNYVEAMKVAEQILNSDPHSHAAHELLAKAAMGADLPRTAVLSLEIVFKDSPKDRKVALALGAALARAGQHAKAEEIYSELLRADPSNSEIAQALKDLSASRTMSEGGYDALVDGKGSYRDILKDKAESTALEQEHREVKTEDVAQNLINEYEARLPTEPNNLRLLRSLADLYAQKSDWDRALSNYERMMTAQTGSDPALEKTIAEIRLKKLDQQLAQLDTNAPDYPDQTARLTAERQAFKLAECQRRAEKYPTDLQIRFELGMIYFEAGKISEAIQEFQKALANPHRRIQSLFYLGQCFARRGMNDMAARRLQDAIKEKVAFDEEKKELIYTLGCVLEKMGKREEAIEQFKLIYEVDIGYKDVAAKVDDYYSGK